jgi:hypothetical protein
MRRGGQQPLTGRSLIAHRVWEPDATLLPLDRGGYP